MVWATVSSWSWFCWLYRASPSLAAKNIINLISVLTIWWCQCIESSLVMLEEGVCYDQCIFLTKLLALILLHFVLLQGQIFYILGISWLPTLHSNPLWWKGYSWHYCCCSVAQSYLTLCNSMDCSTSGFPVLHCLLEFAQVHVHWVSAVMISHHLILYCQIDLGPNFGSTIC